LLNNRTTSCTTTATTARRTARVNCLAPSWPRLVKLVMSKPHGRRPYARKGSISPATAHAGNTNSVVSPTGSTTAMGHGLKASAPSRRDLARNPDIEDFGLQPVRLAGHTLRSVRLIAKENRVPSPALAPPYNVPAHVAFLDLASCRHLLSAG